MRFPAEKYEFSSPSNKIKEEDFDASFVPSTRTPVSTGRDRAMVAEPVRDKI
jgi:hypothetical protein